MSEISRAKEWAMKLKEAEKALSQVEEVGMEDETVVSVASLLIGRMDKNTMDKIYAPIFKISVVSALAVVSSAMNDPEFKLNKSVRSSLEKNPVLRTVLARKLVLDIIAAEWNKNPAEEEVVNSILARIGNEIVGEVLSSGQLLNTGIPVKEEGMNSVEAIIASANQKPVKESSKPAEVKDVADIDTATLPKDEYIEKPDVTVYKKEAPAVIHGKIETQNSEAANEVPEKVLEEKQTPSETLPEPQQEAPVTYPEVEVKQEESGVIVDSSMADGVVLDYAPIIHTPGQDAGDHLIESVKVPVSLIKKPEQEERPKRLRRKKIVSEPGELAPVQESPQAVQEQPAEEELLNEQPAVKPDLAPAASESEIREKVNKIMGSGATEIINVIGSEFSDAEIFIRDCIEAAYTDHTRAEVIKYDIDKQFFDSATFEMMMASNTPVILHNFPYFRRNDFEKLYNKKLKIYVVTGTVMPENYTVERREFVKQRLLGTDPVEPGTIVTVKTQGAGSERSAAIVKDVATILTKNFGG